MKLELESEPAREMTLREHQQKAGRAGRGKCKRRSSFHYSQAAKMRWQKAKEAKIAHAKAVFGSSFPELQKQGFISPQIILS